MPAPTAESRPRQTWTIPHLIEKNPAIRRLGILTDGGDAPGLNAVIRAVVKSATLARVECVGLEDGFDGLMHSERARPLGRRDVAMVTRPTFTACLNWRWLPFVRTSRHPSVSIKSNGV